MFHPQIKIYFTFTELFTDGFMSNRMLVILEFNSFALPLNFILHFFEHLLMTFILIQRCLYLIYVNKIRRSLN
jgi:hypothetical protein